ncbi:hypothetical protein RN001_013600 [Aquatica leii]|uniref:Uncharacterized protein n=1 Tax=Aquatica leii TaxID=1421715 RepID=A0AAN7NWI0_9COLE|nr:hypothetical protein RN001_013600 [Aquatica leii]
MNFDVVVALTLTKAQLEETLTYHLTIEESYTFKELIKQCDSTLEIALRNISKRSPISSMFEQYLLNPNIWIINNNFLINELDDLGKYDRWTTAFIIKNRSAKYKNVSSNECLHELLQQTPKDFAEHQCYSSDRCKEFMFGNRIDTGYVLTHRLLYLYIMRMVRCSISSKDADLLTNKYCSLILKEAKTNEFLGFPQRDIFLEQVTDRPSPKTDIEPNTSRLQTERTAEGNSESTETVNTARVKEAFKQVDDDKNIIVNVSLSKIPENIDNNFKKALDELQAQLYMFERNLSKSSSIEKAQQEALKANPGLKVFGKGHKKKYVVFLKEKY